MNLTQLWSVSSVAIALIGLNPASGADSANGASEPPSAATLKSLEGDLIAIGYAPYHIGLRDAQKGVCRTMLPAHSNWVVALQFTADGSKLATGAGDSLGSVWDVQSGREIGRIRFAGGSTYVRGLSLAKGDQYVAFGIKGEFAVCRMPEISAPR